MQPAAGQREIIAMLTGDAELGDVGELLAEPQARVAALEAEMAELRSAIAELEVERASIAADIEAANRAAREVEERFISHNYRLVLKYANKFWERARHRCDYMDLVSPGNLGMVEAFRKFDPTRGFKFSTFATWHIRQKISQWLREQAPSGPRIPTYRQRDWIAIDYQRNLFFQRNGRQPTLEEIAGLVGKSTDIVLEILRAEAISNSASLDRPISDDDGAGTLGDLLEDQNAVNPERVVELRALGSGLAEIMERTLTPREYRVIQARFGLWDSGRKLTLEKVGEMMNITRERVRQIEARALAKMRQDPLARELKGVDESESAWEEAGEAVA
jgi:RNA polymerase primary sigma factor